MSETTTGIAAAPKQPMMNISGLRVPKDKMARPWRPIPGLEDEYGITQDGRIRAIAIDEVYEPDRWPLIYLPTGDGGIVTVDVVAAIAMVWLDADQRQRIRGALAGPMQHGDPAIRPLVEEFQVSKHAIAKLSVAPDEEIRPIVKQDAAGDAGRWKLENMPIQAYRTFLHEKYRPPSRGGNTSALHLHVLMIDGVEYAFFARGGRRWAYKDDRISFFYRTTPHGRRNILRETIVTVDKNGMKVCRGDRRIKTALRTAPTRLPARRRDWKD